MTSVPNEPEKIPHPIIPQNSPDAADTTHFKLSDPSNFEDFNFAERLGYFKSSLLDYGRSIIDSTVNEESDSQNAKNDIIAANDKVIAQYTCMFQLNRINILRSRLGSLSTAGMAVARFSACGMAFRCDNGRTS